MVIFLVCGPKYFRYFLRLLGPIKGLRHRALALTRLSISGFENASAKLSMSSPLQYWRIRIRSSEDLSLKVFCSWTEVCKEIGNRVKHLINLDQLVDMKLIPKLSNMAHKPSADTILKEKVGGKYEKTMFVLEVFGCQTKIKP